MFRVTSLASMDDRQLNRWIKRLALILVVGGVLFTAFYFFDRWRPATTPIIDQRLSALEQAVRDKPDDVASRGQLADTYVAKGRFQDAITQYNAILDAKKDVELATFGRAGAYLGLEQYGPAATDYQAVVDIAKGGEMAAADPMLEAAYYGLGLIAMKQANAAAGDPVPREGPRDQALRRRRALPDRNGVRGHRARRTRRKPRFAPPSPSCRSAGASRTWPWPMRTLRLASRRSRSGRPRWPTWPAGSPNLPNPA